MHVHFFSNFTKYYKCINYIFDAYVHLIYNCSMCSMVSIKLSLTCKKGQAFFETGMVF